MLLAARNGARRHSTLWLRPVRLRRANSHQTAPYQEPDHEFGPPYTPKQVPNAEARSIGVLGGGITGLAVAYNLSRKIPGAKITIYDEKHRLGGWVESEICKVDGGEVLFEWGPRSLRPDLGGPGYATWNLICQLNILPELLLISKDTAAARNRYIYYHDHLVRMPGLTPGGGFTSALISGISAFLREPIFKGVFSGLLREPSCGERPRGLKDESVGHFIERRFGKVIAQNLVSALFHGIYAGDIYKLSARTLLPMAWHLEERDSKNNAGILYNLSDLLARRMSLVSGENRSFLRRASEDQQRSPLFNGVLRELQHASIYTFINGLQVLPHSIIEALKKNPQIDLKAASTVEGLSRNMTTRQVAVLHTRHNDSSKQVAKHDYVVNTLPPQTLRRLVQNTPTKVESSDLKLTRLSNSLQSAAPGTVSVMVVNLYYSNPNLLPYSGFGYLLPQSLGLDQNPERALGVIFGSETSGPRGDAAHRSRQLPPAEVLGKLHEAKDAQLHQLADLIQRHPEVLPRIEELRKRTRTGRSELFVKILAELKDEKRRQALGPLDPRLKQWQPNELETRLSQILDKLFKVNLANDIAEQKVAPTRVGQDTAPGTKLTVMMGGHWWSGWQESDIPTPEEAVEMARTLLARHLGVSEEPVLAKARLQRDCIPQYQVGIQDDMAKVHSDLIDVFDGRLKVAGTWWGAGVGVNDCTRGAWEAATSIREAWDDATGLEDMGEPRAYMLKDQYGKYSIDPLSPHVQQIPGGSRLPMNDARRRKLR